MRGQSEARRSQDNDAVPAVKEDGWKFNGTDKDGGAGRGTRSNLLIAVAYGIGDASPRPRVAPTVNPTPMTGLPAAETRAVAAPIERAEILIRESAPPSYAVEIQSGLPNGCVRFDGISVSREDATVRIDVTNREPADLTVVSCMAIYGMVETTVGLPGEYEGDTTYTVLVNDTELTFEGKASGGIISGRDALFESLQRSELEVDRGEEVSQPFFKPTGEIMRVFGEDVQVFEFPSATQAEAAAGGVSPDGSTIASADGSVSSVFWIAVPHFYRVDNMIALYVGNNAEVLNLLDEHMGPQFAGSAGVANEPPDREMVREPAPIESVELAAPRRSRRDMSSTPNSGFVTGASSPQRTRLC